MKYGIKFEKGGEIKFTGHLDLLKIFQRAINRAGLPVAYSQGYNPHQLLTFASPLSLGMTSRAEYGEIELSETLPEEEITSRLSAALPEGLRIIRVFPLKPGEKIGMGAIAAAAYEIGTDLPPDLLRERLPEFLAREEILITKKTKKGFREVNIRDDIYRLDAAEDGTLKALIAAGSERNLKPELLTEALFGFLGADFDRYRLRIERRELYRRSAAAGSTVAGSTVVGSTVTGSTVGGLIALDTGEDLLETITDR